MTLYQTKTITYRNGFFFLENFEEEEIPAWITKDYSDLKPYFHLNLLTREKFKRDLLPGIKENKILISKDTFNLIKYYPKTDYSIQGVVNTPHIEPEGITLKDHQDIAVNIMLKNKKFGFFLGTGTGKTLIAITWLLNKKLIGDILIVTPKKVIDQYQDECKKYLPKDILDRLTIINFESLNKVADYYFEAVIVDESHRAKSATSKIYLTLSKIIQKADYAYLFTGTPQDKQRHDIITQLSLLDKRYMPSKTRMLFRYFLFDDYYTPKQERAEVKDEIDSMINEITWGKETHEVINLTEENIFKVMCPHPGLFYEELKKEYIVNIGGLDIVADNKGVLKIKLREICSGHIKTTEEPIKTIELPNPKVEPLENLLETVKHGIIYTEFDEDIVFVTRSLNKLKRTYVIVNGKTKKSGHLIDKFKEGEVDYLVIQSKSGNAGLDLTNTNNVIFYSMPESYIVYHQCKSRIRRIGQHEACNYYHLICENTVEEQIYNSLKRKKSFSTRLFKLYN